MKRICMLPHGLTVFTAALLAVGNPDHAHAKLLPGTPLTAGGAPKRVVLDLIIDENSRGAFMVDQGPIHYFKAEKRKDPISDLAAPTFTLPDPFAKMVGLLSSGDVLIKSQRLDPKSKDNISDLVRFYTDEDANGLVAGMKKLGVEWILSVSARATSANVCWRSSKTSSRYARTGTAITSLNTKRWMTPSCW